MAMSEPQLTPAVIRTDGTVDIDLLRRIAVEAEPDYVKHSREDLLGFADMARHMKDVQRLTEAMRGTRTMEWEMAHRWPANPDGVNRRDDRPLLTSKGDNADAVAWQRIYMVGRCKLAWILDATMPFDLTYRELEDRLEQDRRERFDRLREADRDARTIDIDPTVQHIKTDRWSLYAGTAEAILADVDDESVDLIVTDPPYPVEFQPLWSMVAEQAARVLVPQGIVVALTGKIHLDEVMGRLGDHLAYGWTYCAPVPGSNTRILARHVTQTWKPWLAYSKGPWPAGRVGWHPDLLQPDPRAKDRYHWEQQTGPAIQLIERLCPADGLVLDPFTGSGSYGEAALIAGRRFLGIEPDAERFLQARERLEQVVP